MHEGKWWDTWPAIVFLLNTGYRIKDVSQSVGIYVFYFCGGDDRDVFGNLGYRLGYAGWRGNFFLPGAKKLESVLIPFTP